MRLKAKRSKSDDNPSRRYQSDSYKAIDRGSQAVHSSSQITEFIFQQPSVLINWKNLFPLPLK